MLWQRQQGGYDFKHDFVRVVLSPSDGELLAYRKNWGQTPEAFTIRISKDTAIQAAGAGVVLHFKAKRAPDGNVSGPVVVCPNDVFGASPVGSDTRRLAWVVAYPKQPEYRNDMEVWVDAENGRLLGGEILW